MKKVLITFMLLFMYLYSNAQNLNWTQYGQQAEGASTFAWNNAKTKLYKGTYYLSVHMSLDSGLTWQPIYQGLNGGVYSIAIKNDTIYGDFNNCFVGGIRYTANDGITWTRIDNGANQMPVTYDIATTNNAVVIAAYDQIKSTVDDGQTWFTKSTPINTFTVATEGNAIIAGCSGGAFTLYYSNDNGQTYTSHVAQNMAGGWDLEFKDGVIYAGTTNGLYRSNDTGKTWIYKGMAGQNVMGLGFYGQFGFASSANNSGQSTVFFSSDSGNTWVEENFGLPVDPEILDFTFVDNKVIAGGWGSGMWSANLPTLAHLQESKKEETFLIYPNPATNTISIQIEPNQVTTNSSIEIFTLCGASLLKKSLNSIEDYTNIDISSILPGIYLIKCSGKDYSNNQKLIVSKN
ncbi:MAG TPA: T9SS type A sorting domain-containing protein [Bacteroidia bacterium]|nr:T9SS type A sorting domain-containing protein [Bacteroidia bacterium]